jgi:hypothetical protein
MQFEIYRDMVRSDQMSPAQVMQFLADHPDFAAWYKAQMR